MSATKHLASDAKLQYWRERYQRQKAEREAQATADPLEGLVPVDIAYLAGLVDGEGCIGIGHNGRCYVPTVQIIMTAQPLLEWVGQCLGVPCATLKKRNSPRHRTQYEVRIGGRRAVWFCMLIGPYLREKHLQAEAIIEFGETYQTGYDNGGAVPASVNETRAALKARIHELKAATLPAAA